MISWTEFLVPLLIVVLIYYPIAIFYYKKKTTGEIDKETVSIESLEADNNVISAHESTIITNSEIIDKELSVDDLLNVAEGFSAEEEMLQPEPQVESAEIEEPIFFEDHQTDTAPVIFEEETQIEVPQLNEELEIGEEPSSSHFKDISMDFKEHFEPPSEFPEEPDMNLLNEFMEIGNSAEYVKKMHSEDSNFNGQPLEQFLVILEEEENNIISIKQPI